MIRIWLPNPLYQIFPLLSVILGFFIVALFRNVFGVIVAGGMYFYSFSVLWLRLPDEPTAGD